MSELNVERKYKKLTHIEHILLRPERHLGSIRSAKVDTWVYNPETRKVDFKKDFEYCPALIKQFDEIIINSVDHSKTPEGKSLNEIRVNINRINNCITVQDNGGIPVVKHKEHDEWIPEMLFGSLFAGSNFNDDDEDYNNKQSGGQNGEGASLVNVFSKWFRVDTCDGVKKFSQIFENNLSKRSNPIISKNRNHGTVISWIPDYERLGLKDLQTNDILMMFRRVFEVAACNPKLKIFLNGERVAVDKFSNFVGFFGDNIAVDETPDWLVGVGESAGQFTHYSYVNSIATHVGGPHIDYVADQIINAVRPELEKHFKTQLKPAMIKNHMTLFISANIDNPRFDSQTKERMTTPVSQFGSTYKVSSKLINKAKAVIKAGLQVEISALRNDKQSSEDKKIEDEIAKRSFRDIPKYYPATERNDRSKCVVMLTEGDSASNPILSVRNTKTQGLFTLRGKSLNVMNATKSALLQNKEIQNLCVVLGGVKLFKPLDFSKLRYQHVIISTDADVDGMHIRGLITNLFYLSWPEFIKQGRLRIFRTPCYRVWYRNETLEFTTTEEYEQWVADNNNPKHESKFVKGIGGNSSKDFKKYLDDLDKYTDVVTIDEAAEESLRLAFDDSLSDERKNWFSDFNIFQTGDQE